MHDFGERLKDCFLGRVCLMGLGDAGRGDDGFGVLLAERIAERLRGAGRTGGPASVIIAGTAPERFIVGIEQGRFDSLVFLDAVEVGAAPGSVVLLEAGEMISSFPQVSTHRISLGTLAICAGTFQTRAWLLGVQPQSLGSSEKLTPAVLKSLDILTEELWRVIMDKENPSNNGRRPEGRPSPGRTYADS